MSGSGARRRTSGAGRGLVLGAAMTAAVGLLAMPAFAGLLLALGDLTLGSGLSLRAAGTGAE
jgi:hypothetical protein